MIEIGSKRLRAKINPHGAELSSLLDTQGQEWMTDADPAYWSGRAPLLFPIVGRLNRDTYRIGSREFSLPQHGFARRQRFEVVRSEASRATFRLTENEATLAAFPFAFALEATFAIARATLSIDVTVINRGPVPMPASFGFHPAFAWPLPGGGPRGEHAIRFAQNEPASLAGLDAEGLVASIGLPGPLHDRTLTLDDALFDQGALIWTHLRSESVQYARGDRPGLEIGFPGAPMLGIWSKPGAHFVCIEPWWGIADRQGYDGDFWDKPGILRFATGEARTFSMQVTLAD